MTTDQPMPQLTPAEPDGVAWLNPADLPAGVQVSRWDFDDDGQPHEAPVTLETVATHTELTVEEAVRIARALLGAAGVRLVSGG